MVIPIYDIIIITITGIIHQFTIPLIDQDVDKFLLYKFVQLKYFIYICSMGFNKKIYNCENSGQTIIKGEDLILEKNENQSIKLDSKEELLKEDTIKIPEKDIRVSGC